MDGPFYVDTLEPHITADIAAVTLASTFKSLVPVSNLPSLGSQRISRLGKRYRGRAFGRITTAATPGNLQLALFYGTGADANGVNLAQSAAVALIAAQTNISWELIFELHCRAAGASGTVFVTGRAHFGAAVIASTNQPLLIPATAPAVSAAIDLTSPTNVLSIQALRSGSTVETMQVHDFYLQALN